MQSTLQQHASAAQLQHLVNLSVNGLERKDVAVLRSQRAVERAKRAIFRAKVRVVDIPVDLIRRYARIVLFHAQLVSFHSNADQVVGLQHVQSLLFRDPHVALLNPRESPRAVVPEIYGRCAVASSPACTVASPGSAISIGLTPAINPNSAAISYNA